MKLTNLTRLFGLILYLLLWIPAMALYAQDTTQQFPDTAYLADSIHLEDVIIDGEKIGSDTSELQLPLII